MSTLGRSRWGAGVLLAALIGIVLAGSGFDSTASAQSPAIDYDADDDGLIEVTSEAQMSAIRWDLNGNGAADESVNATNYSSAFPGAVLRMGCPATGCTGYELAASISLGGSWEPIGDNTDNFTATFDGNAPSYTIGNLFITRTTDYSGLFGVTGTRSVIRNVKLTLVYVVGNDYVGALAGRSRGRISNCETTGTVEGRWWIGGLIGWSEGAITASVSSATVSSQSGGIVGGLLGESTAAIEDSSASGTVEAPAWAGGLVGRNKASITGSTASGAVTATRTSGSSLAGGLVGQNLAAPIQNSHASGDVTGSQNTVGGLVGSNYDELAGNGSTTPRNTIIGSTASGTVTTTGSNVGGLVGWNNGSISDSAAFNSSVTGAHRVGGLVGANYDQQADGSNTIDRSTATASVTGTNAASLNVGGLVGWNNGPVRDSYAGGAVQGVAQKGGLIGSNNPGGRVIDSRADGAVGDSADADSTLGGLVGLNKGAVAGSVATGTVSGSAASNTLGGLVGRNEGSISGSAATGAVSGGSRVGGLVGYGTYAGRITESWARGAVSAISLPNVSESGTMVGGLVGWNDGAVGASFATGNVTGTDLAGGLMGRNLGMLIATHATGNVTVSGSPFCTPGVVCSEGVGGLIGFALERTLASTLTTPFTYSASSVEASYSTGSVSGDSTHILGGLAGNAERDTTTPSDSASFTNSYWDTGTSGQTLGVGSDDEDENGTIDGTETATAGVTGQTTTALKAPTGYTGIFADWNVSIPNVTARVGGPWDFGAATDYPVLRGPSTPPSLPAGTATRSVAEERTADTPIGSPLTATDSDGDALSYKLVGADATFFAINGMTGQLLTKAILDYEQPDDADRDNEYEFMIQARDGTSVAFRPVTVTVTDAIENLAAPIITGGATVTVTENSTVVVTYQAVDPDGATSTFTWTLGGDDAGAFEISNRGVLTFDPAPDFEAPGDADRNNIYEVTVQANDGGRTGELDVLVTVEGGDDPPVVEGVATVTIAENSTAPVATYRAHDPDRATNTFTWSLAGNDAGAFNVSDRGLLTFDRAPNFEAPGDANGNNIYEVTVEANDGLTGELDVLVTVEDVDEPPEIDGDARFTIAENSATFVGSYSASDPEGAITSWETLDGPDARYFAFDNGALSFLDTPDYEARSSKVYRVTVRATDESNMRGSLPVTVTLTNVNEAPTIGGPETIDVNEGHTGTLGTYGKDDPERSATNWGSAGSADALSGADADRFRFDKETRRLTFATSPDFEDGGGRYEITLNANDGELNGRLDVTVNLANVEERGTLTFDRRQPVVGRPMTATLTDPDNVVSPTWIWQRSTSRSGGWTDIASTNSRTYTPVSDDSNHYLRAAVTYQDGHGPDKTLQAVTDFNTAEDRVSNAEPVLPDSVTAIELPENARPGRNFGGRVQATDADNDPITYSLSGESEFVIDQGTGQISVAPDAAFDFDAGRGSYTVTVTAADGFGGTDTVDVTITIAGVGEPPAAADDAFRSDEDTAATIDVLANDSDPEDDRSTLTVGVVRRPAQGAVVVNDPVNPGDRPTITYTPRANYSGADSFTYRARDTGGLISSVATVVLTIDGVNDAPVFPAATADRRVSERARPGDPVGAPVTAMDRDGDDLVYSLTGSPHFEMEGGTAQITVRDGAALDATNQPTHTVTVSADDGEGPTASIEVTITVTTGPVQSAITGGGGGGFFAGGGGGGGGGGGPTGPTPSDEDFEWSVSRDIEELDSDHGSATGAWSDGATLWLLENGDGADDAIYAYDLESGERVEDREFELDDANLAPRGVWSDRHTIWISDSGKEKLFAHDLASGDRLHDSDLALHTDNDDPRGIWSNGVTIWVLDGRDDALFGYDLASGELLGEYALDDDNDDPRGIFSDRVSVWVSDHGAKRLFAYRLPAPEGPAAEDAEPIALERVRDEEFAKLSGVSNNSPRGLWSDGGVMYVADESDGKVYSYNMPDAIDARLASLELSDADIGEFSSSETEYEGVASDDATGTTVEALAEQRRAMVAIEPPDSDEATDGDQVALDGLEEITVTVTSADGSRSKVYRVRFGGAAEEQPVVACLRGAISEGFSLLIYAGGSVEYLETCAQSRGVTALYVSHQGEYVPYILGAPAFVNEAFVALYPEGLPALTPLIAKSEGPPSPAPPSDGVPEFGPDCLRGTIVSGFSLVLYEGGSVEDLDSCAQSSDVTAVYALIEGEYVPYILGAPDFVNEAFVALFPVGLAPVTPLIAKSD